MLRFFLLFLLISKIKLGAWRKRLCLHYYGDMGDEECKPNGVFEVLAALCSKAAGLGYGLAGTMETRLARSPVLDISMASAPDIHSWWPGPWVATP